MANETDQIEDRIDAMAQAFDRIANALWDEGRRQRAAGTIDREQYAQVKNHCRALSRRAMELTTSASRYRLERLGGSLTELKKLTEKVEQAKERIERIEAGLSIAVAAVVAVTAVVTAVTTANPASIGAAVAAAGDLVAAASAAGAGQR